MSDLQYPETPSATTQRRRPRTPSPTNPRQRTARIAANLSALFVGVCFIIPLAWIILTSLNPKATVSLSWPKAFSIENFQAVWTFDQTFRPILNSIVISGGTAALAAIAALLAAYPLSRYRMRFKQPFMYTILFGTCLPITAIMVPVYYLFVSFHLLDSTFGVIGFIAASALPMAIWMMKNFMDSVPISLEEAAWVDGANSMKALFRIVAPLMTPGIAVVFVFVFTSTWGNFFVPFILLQTPAKQPAAVSVYSFFGMYGTIQYGKLAAFAILYSTPALALYLLAQRLSGGSFTMAGAVKG